MMKRSRHPSPLISGSVDKTMKSKTLCQRHLQRGYPLIKPLISGSVDERPKPNSCKLTSGIQGLSSGCQFSVFETFR
jgi:hypothetical protein